MDKKHNDAIIGKAKTIKCFTTVRRHATPIRAFTRKPGKTLWYQLEHR